MTALASFVALGVIVLIIAVTALLAAADASVHLLTRARVRRLVETGGRAESALEELIERPGRVLSSEALVAALGYAASGAVIAWALVETYPSLPTWSAMLLGFVIGAVVVFTLAEALPRTVALQNPERVAIAAAPWALRVTTLAYPVARVLSAPWAGLFRLTGGEPGVKVPWVTEDEYRERFPVDEEETAREETEDALIEAVADFAEKIVREVMVPRTDMVCLPDTATFDEALEAIASHGYSRLPVFHETLDDITGVVYAKDLLLQQRGGECARVSPADIARPAFFVPETKPVEELLIEMRNRTHLAVVADEYGGTAGLVTIEDLIEEIVGEIFDEYDREQPMVTELPDGRFRVDARLPVDELNERFGTAVEREADTVGGLFTELAGRIPVVGETVDVEGLRLIVRDMQGTRICALDVESAREARDEEDGDA